MYEAASKAAFELNRTNNEKKKKKKTSTSERKLLITEMEYNKPSYSENEVQICRIDSFMQINGFIYSLSIQKREDSIWIRELFRKYYIYNIYDTDSATNSKKYFEGCIFYFFQSVRL